MTDEVLFAIAVVLVAVRLGGALAHRLGQPQVVGELIVGVLLGPSVLGSLLPDVGRVLFPASVVDALDVVARFGLVLFMLLVGMELDVLRLPAQVRGVALIATSTLVVPMALAAGLAQFLYDGFAGGVDRVAFTLFLATAMSVTALPVLARLLDGMGLRGTRIGAISLSCAALNDVVAWLVLAGAIGLVGAAGGGGGVLGPVLLTVGFIAVMFGLVRPALTRLPSVPVWVAVVVAALGAGVGELIGIHAVFGALVAGAVMPRDVAWRRVVHRQLDGLVTPVMLPIYFVVVGLSTDTGGLDTATLLIVLPAVFAVATLGKLGGGAVAARLTGESWSSALSIGALLNARGVTEIVMLTVGLELGVIGPELFTVMVVMAIGTTVLAAPVLQALRWWGRRPRPVDVLAASPRSLPS